MLGAEAEIDGGIGAVYYLDLILDGGVGGVGLGGGEELCGVVELVHLLLQQGRGPQYPGGECEGRYRRKIRGVD